MGTVIGIILAIISSLVSFAEARELPAYLPFLLVTLLIFLSACQWLTLGLAYAPLQKAEKNLTPGILRLLKEDHLIVWVQRILIALPIFFLFLVLYPHVLPIPISLWGFIALGLTFDLLYALNQRIFSFLNPYSLTKMFTKAAKKSILLNREINLCDSIESLSEVGLKSLEDSGSSLCNHSLDEMREIMDLFLLGAKSAALEGPDKQAQASGITDKVSYTLFFFLERLELIFQKALTMGLTQVCSTIITILGKLIFYATRCDFSLMSYPVHFLGKFSKKAEEKHFSEVSLKGSCALLEVSRKIINELPLEYMDLKDPFFAVIHQLDEIAKETFKQDKTSNIAVLIVSLKDLRATFSSPKVINHSDTSAIVGEIDRVLAEWETLESVLRTIPTL